MHKYYIYINIFKDSPFLKNRLYTCIENHLHFEWMCMHVIAILFGLRCGWRPRYVCHFCSIAFIDLGQEFYLQEGTHPPTL